MLPKKEARPFDLMGHIISYESGELSSDGLLALFSHLVKTVLAWSLQGAYGRTAAGLIEAGLIEAKTGHILRAK